TMELKKFLAIEMWRIELIRKPIKYESTIALFHVPTRKYLSTKRVKYPKNKQYMVVCTDKELDFEHDLWTICDMNVKVPFSTCNIFGFKHKETGEKLHSHFTVHGTTPKSNHQQVTLWMHGAPDEHWIIRHHGSKVDLDHLMDGDVINLFHKRTNLPLYSHDVLLDDGTQEVSCNGDGREDNNM
ncbi:399_t:CDS:2, partial [Acaulospora morrowiae]